METKLLTMKKPPIDLGIGIYDNGKVYKVSLIFVDLLINLKDRDILFGIGIPLFWAGCFYAKFGETK